MAGMTFLKKKVRTSDQIHIKFDYGVETPLLGQVGENVPGKEYNPMQYDQQYYQQYYQQCYQQDTYPFQQQAYLGYQQ